MPIKQMRAQRSLPALFLVLLLALVLLAGWQWRNGPPVAASMLDLLPQGAGDALMLQAEQRMQEPLNRDLLILVGHPQRATAIALAEQLAQNWSDSAHFASVQWQFSGELDDLRSTLASNRLSLLPSADRAALTQHPDTFIQQRATQILSPFGSAGLLPMEQDWLGLGLRAQHGLNPQQQVEPDLASGALLISQPEMTWALLRASSQGNSFDTQSPLAIAGAVAQARQQVSAAGGQLLAASGLLYAAAGQSQATKEVSWIGGSALLSILLLLLVSFRRSRALLSFLPVGVAFLAGCSACVLLFGQINALTLILGASLIGVASDYPLHFLSKSWGQAQWQSWPTLRRILPGLSLGLATNLLGYLALAFTPFPALTQIAVFSAAGLIAAYLCTLCLLPSLLNGIALQPSAAMLTFSQRLLNARQGLLQRVGSRALLALLLLFCAGGVYQVQSQNDVRQWLSQEPQLLAEAQQIAALTGEQPTSQFFLVRADDEQQLLQRLSALSTRLDEFHRQGQLRGYRSLNQLLLADNELQQLRSQLATLPAHWQPLLDLGIPEAALQQELAQLLTSPTPTLETLLASPLGEPWRALWLGRNEAGVAAIVSLQGQPKTSVLSAAAEGIDGVQLIDRIAELNQLFAATQLSAAELKLLSCVGILLLLCLPFGFAGALRVVCLPLLAALAALATLGWLGQPLTLFSLFGLLLITAIGVDYAILMREAVGGLAVSLLGTLLSAITSWLSFGLLLVSQTPAIANFGLVISLGLMFSFLLCPWASKPATTTSPTSATPESTQP